MLRLAGRVCVLYIKGHQKFCFKTRTNHYLLLRLSCAHNQVMSVCGVGEERKSESIQCGAIISYSISDGVKTLGLIF